MRKLGSSQITKSNIFKASDYQRPGLTQDEVLQLKEAFDLFDSNTTGIINSKQLKTGMSTLGFETNSPTLFHIISDLATTNTSIDFPTFIDLMTASAGAKITKKNVKKVFGLFDDEKTGFVSIKNLRKLAKQLSLDLSENQLQILIQKADLDNDGLVSEEEFYEIMSK